MSSRSRCPETVGDTRLGRSAVSSVSDKSHLWPQWWAVKGDKDESRRNEASPGAPKLCCMLQLQQVLKSRHFVQCRFIVTLRNYHWNLTLWFHCMSFCLKSQTRLMMLSEDLLYLGSFYK